MLSSRLFVFLVASSVVAVVQSQIPSFGGCPDYAPMADFDKDRFLGTWYEAQRYFTVTELVAKCITATYERRQDGQIWVSNALINRLTGVQRIVSGTMKLLGKRNEGKFNVKYNSFPVSYDSTFYVLDTDYDSFAVIWSCNTIGPIGHTESVWLMTRDREAPGTVMQRAYGVLDKYKLSRSFFVETDQKTCETLPPPTEAVDPTVEPSASRKTTPKPVYILTPVFDNEPPSEEPEI